MDKRFESALHKEGQEGIAGFGWGLWGRGREDWVNSLFFVKKSIKIFSFYFDSSYKFKSLFKTYSMFNHISHQENAH